MAIPLSINGAVFEYPENFDENWGINATGWAQAVTNGMLQRQGGNFPLTADANFGASFGLVALYYKSRSTPVATAGTVRLASADPGIAFRNNANSGNLILTTNSSDNLLFNGVQVGTGGTVNAGTANQLAYYATSTNAVSGLTAITANRALISNASGLPIASSVTNTELGFVSGVTSAIQPQLNARVVIVGTTSTSTDTTSTSFVDTNLTATITPTSASSRIRVIVNTITERTAPVVGAYVALTVKRGVTNLGDASFGLAAFVTETTATTPIAGGALMVVDSPATTSATTYTLQVRSSNASQHSVACLGTVNTITLEEIA